MCKKVDIQERWSTLKQSHTVIIAIVYGTLMLDNMLLTAVVPVLPEFFYKKHLVQTDGGQNTTMTAENNLTSFSNVTQSNETGSSNRHNCKTSNENAFLAQENLYIGILFASKPLVQIVANLAVGPLTDVIGFDIPMFAGYLIICSSAVLFAFGGSYPVLLVARAIQGIGSACASTAGMGMVADSYSDKPKQRGKGMGLALGGLAMGVLIGPVFGSVVYQLAGKEAVFLVLAALAAVLAVIQLCMRTLSVDRRLPGEEGTPLKQLFSDPYILIAASSLMIGNMCIGVLETGQPIWMIRTMCAKKWQLGIAFIPESVSYLVGTNVIALWCQNVPKWLICILGLYAVSVGTATLPLARSMWEVFPSGIVVGLAVAMIDTSIFPIMATLVDRRHKPVYGSVYAIADVAFCVSFIVGPLCAGGIIGSVGFGWLMFIVAIICFLFAPLVYLLRKQTLLSEENIPILYTTNNSTDSDLSSNGRMVGSDD